MGPGLLLKGILQGGFSLMIFGWVQILMDIQPLLAMLAGDHALHGVSHTFMGAVIIALLGAWSGRLLVRWFVTWETRRGGGASLAWCGLSAHVAWWVALLSAFLGAGSHVFMDSIMHWDVQPWYPWSQEATWYRWVDLSTLHTFCVYSGLLGLVMVLLVRAWVGRKPW